MLSAIWLAVCVWFLIEGGIGFFWPQHYLALLVIIAEFPKKQLNSSAISLIIASLGITYLVSIQQDRDLAFLIALGIPPTLLGGLYLLAIAKWQQQLLAIFASLPVEQIKAVGLCWLILSGISIGLTLA